jgi:hypothetical protein
MPGRRVVVGESFRDTTAEPRQIAGLYLRMLVYALVWLADVVALDFVRRPQLV